MANEFVARNGLIAQNNSIISGSLSQGSGSTASGLFSHAEGFSTVASSNGSHAEGQYTVASGIYSHAEGHLTSASGFFSHAEGQLTTAIGNVAHAEGYYTTASGDYSHAEGNGTTATGFYSHAEGQSTNAIGQASHAEGLGTTATGNWSHAEGSSTNANGEYSHAEGVSTNAAGNSSHAEGENTVANGQSSHAEGYNTSTTAAYQHAQGKYNATSAIEGAFILGNGVSGTLSNLILAANDFVDISGSLHVKPNTTASVDLLSANKEQISEVITTGQDTSFQSNYEANSVVNGAINACAYLSSGDLVVGGVFNKINSSDPAYFGKINADGTPNTAFNTNLGAGFNGDVYCVLPQTNGKILVGGVFGDLDGSTRNYLVRLNSDGTEDTTFYTNLGTAFTDAVHALAQNSNGDIFVGGDFTSFDGNSTARLVKLDSTGTEDTAFTTNLGTGFDFTVYAIEVQSDGKILVGGRFADLNGTTRNSLVRLNTNGTVDTSFYSNYDTSGGLNDRVRSIKIQSDGKIVVGGYFGSFNGNSRKHLIRLNSDGTEDSSFYTNLGTSFDDLVFSIQIQLDDKILVGGQYTDFNSATRYRLVRLNSDGTEDSSFYTLLGGSFDNTIYSVATDSSGNIAAGGNFVSFNSTTATYLVKLSSTYNAPYKENVSINRAPDNNLINIKGSSNGYNIVDVQDSNGTQIFTLNNTGSLAHGRLPTASGNYSHAQGRQTIASGYGSHAEGREAQAQGDYSHAEGSSISYGSYSHAEGGGTVASGSYSHAEGREATTIGNWSHAEGYLTIAQGDYSHAEGRMTTASGLYSHAEGVGTVSLGGYSHAEGEGTLARGDGSHAEGWYTLASASYSHAEGYFATASGAYSHAEGSGSRAQGDYSHAEGDRTVASGSYSHAEGRQTSASAIYSHAEGFSTTALGSYSHAEGRNTITSGSIAHAEGFQTIARGDGSHAEGNQTIAQRDYSHAEGDRTIASGSSSHAEGYLTVTTGSYSHAEGSSTIARGDGSHAEGFSTLASGLASHAEGDTTVASGSYSHAEGQITIASGSYSHAEGKDTKAIGAYSHAEGLTTTATGISSHAEGDTTQALDDYAHAEGRNTVASSKWSHAEGYGTLTSGGYSHAEGYFTTASGLYSHAEGETTIAIGRSSHAEGYFTTASGIHSHAEGRNTNSAGTASHAEGHFTRTGLLGYIASVSSGVVTIDAAYGDVKNELVDVPFIVLSDATFANAYGTRVYSYTGMLTGPPTTFTLSDLSVTSANVIIGSPGNNAPKKADSVILGHYAHSEGSGSQAEGDYSHAEGINTIAIGSGSHTEGAFTTTIGSFQHASGIYNRPITNSGAFIIGNGIANANRSNLFEAYGSTVLISGSLRGEVSALSISSNTASINLASNNFFTLNLVNGANTHISASNILPGQTVNLRVTQGSAGTGTVSFNAAIDQPSGSFYTGSMIANATDIVTFITFDSSLVYVSAIRNLV